MLAYSSCHKVGFAKFAQVQLCKIIFRESAMQTFYAVLCSSKYIRNFIN